MTIIAWDGKTLAADRAAVNVGYIRAVTKIFVVPGGLVGFAGDGDYALELLHWFKTGREIEKYPKCMADSNVGAMFIDRDGVNWGYSKTPFPQRCEDKFDAMGSGRDYALATMYLGHDAVKAVQIASALDNCCGKGVDSLTLKDIDE